MFLSGHKEMSNEININIFWIPSIFLALGMLLPNVINGSFEPFYLLSLLLIPIYFIIMVLVCYFLCGGTIKELLEKEKK